MFYGNSPNPYGAPNPPGNYGNNPAMKGNPYGKQTPPGNYGKNPALARAQRLAQQAALAASGALSPQEGMPVGEQPPTPPPIWTGRRGKSSTIPTLTAAST